MVVGLVRLVSQPGRHGLPAVDASNRGRQNDGGGDDQGHDEVQQEDRVDRVVNFDALVDDGDRH